MLCFVVAFSLVWSEGREAEEGHGGAEMIGSNGPATPREADQHESSRKEHPATGSFYFEAEAARRAGGGARCPGWKNVFSSVSKCNEIYIPTRERNGREGSNGREERGRKQ